MALVVRVVAVGAHRAFTHATRPRLEFDCHSAAGGGTMSKCVLTDINNDLEDIYRRVDNSVAPELLEKLKSMIRYVAAEDPQDERHFDRVIKTMRRKFNAVPKKSNLLLAYAALEREGEIPAPPRSPAFRQWLTRKVGKSNSGVLVITVLTSPYPQVEGGKPQRFSCEWNCYYCPNEPGQPRSYLHDEPVGERVGG